MATQSDLDNKLIVVLQDTAELLDSMKLNVFVDEAVQRYSKDRPLELVAAITGDGGYDYDLPKYEAVAIEGLSQAAACVVTWAGHGLSGGDQVRLSGITQADWTALNRVHTITWLSADTFSIPVNTSGFALAYDPGSDPGQVLALGKDWVDGFSVALGVEYPAGEQVPCMLDESAWMIYQGTAGKKLRFLTVSLGTGETAVLRYTAPHLVDSSTSTIPATDQDAVVNLAGALACYALARKHAQSVDSTIGADNVSQLSKSGEYAKRGKELEALYKNHMAPPAKDGGLTAASVSGDWDTHAGWGSDRVTHPKRYR